MFKFYLKPKKIQVGLINNLFHLKILHIWNRSINILQLVEFSFSTNLKYI